MHGIYFYWIRRKVVLILIASNYDLEFKLAVVRENLNGESATNLYRKYGVSAVTIAKWRNKYMNICKKDMSKNTDDVNQKNEGTVRKEFQLLSDILQLYIKAELDMNILELEEKNKKMRKLVAIIMED